MGLATFRGGVHPFEGKELSMDRAVTVLKPTSGEMVYPLSQHIGAPAKAIVKVGDEVLVGQKIAEAGGFISAVVVSSVSGKVKKIEPRVTAGGAKSISIVIENDGQYTAVEGLGKTGLRQSSASRKSGTLCGKPALWVSAVRAFRPM